MNHQHTFKTCKEDCGAICKTARNDGADCLYSILGVCRVCTLAEGELTEDCPGVKVSWETQCWLVDGMPEYTVKKGWFKRPTYHGTPGDQTLIGGDTYHE